MLFFFRQLFGLKDESWTSDSMNGVSCILLFKFCWKDVHLDSCCVLLAITSSFLRLSLSPHLLLSYFNFLPFFCVILFLLSQTHTVHSSLSFVCKHGGNQSSVTLITFTNRTGKKRTQQIRAVWHFKQNTDVKIRTKYFYVAYEVSEKKHILVLSYYLFDDW